MQRFEKLIVSPVLGASSFECTRFRLGVLCGLCSSISNLDRDNRGGSKVWGWSALDLFAVLTVPVNLQPVYDPPLET